MALVFASMIGGLSISTAFAKDKDNDKHEGYHEQGRNEHGQRAHHPPPPRRYYSEPVYAPPPVICTPNPYQSPGISLVFPIVIR
jgi:hypothetical protein